MKKQISRKGNRLFALLLAVAMMFSVMPMNAIAVGETNADGYIEIDSIEDLYLINQDLTAKYILTADIDMTEATAEGGDWDFYGNGWNPIGSNNVYGGGAFSGEFDGNGHKIIGMRIDVTSFPSGTKSQVYYGLFAKITGSVHDLTFVGGNILNDGYSYNKQYAGALAGYSENATVFNVRSEMNEIFVSTHDLDSYCGGIVGYGTTTTITNCSNATKVYANGKQMSKTYVGGILGYGEECSVEKSYNEGACTAEAESYRTSYSPYRESGAFVGGICAQNYGGIVSNCYNTSSVLAKSSNGDLCYAFGIVGNGTVQQCYNIGAVDGRTRDAIGGSDIANSYYLSNIGSGNTGTTSLTKGQMLMQIMYVGFDFENVWAINSEAVYPYPQLKNNPQDLRVIKDVDFTAPTKTVYDYKEEFDITGANIKINYTDGTFDIIKEDKIKASGYDSNTPGVQTVTFTYEEYTFTAEVTVKEIPFIEVRTVEDLYNIRKNMAGYYILANDIDLTEATAVGGDWDFDGRGWNPIGSNDVYGNEAFSGLFDGNGYSIIGMRIYVERCYNKGNLGLFANVSGTVRNLNLKEVNIGAYDDQDFGYIVGGITATNSGLIENCSVEGVVDGGYGGYSDRCVGGITGINNGEITKCFVLGSVSDGTYAGGIAGEQRGGTISKCYFKGTAQSSNLSGGIAGWNHNAYGKAYITECYSICEAVHAIARNEAGSVSNCYYLVDSGEGAMGATALTNAQMKLDFMFAGFDFENVWVLDPYANHPYPQLRSNIQDMKQSVEVVRVIALPEKTEYYTGDKIDLTGLMVEVVYISGKTEIITVTEDMISGFDSSLTGEQTVTVTFGGQTSSFNVNVEQRPAISGLTLVNQPDNNDYFVGTAFDFSGAKIKIEYTNGDSEIKDVTVDMTTGGNINVLGKQTIVVNVESFSVSFDVTVSQLKVVSFKISKLPNKVTYLEGESLDLDGLVLSATYNNNNTLVVNSGYTVSGYENTPGVHTVKITYFDKSAEFNVIVKAKSVVSLELRQGPAKTEYFEGDAFDTTGIVLIAIYDTTEVAVVEDYVVSGYDGIAGIKTITLSYGEKSVSFTVQIFVRTVTQLIITNMPAKTQYIENEALDLTGLKVFANYNDGSIIEVTDYQVVGFSSTVGTHVISIMYGGQSVTYDITVSEKQLSDLVITLPDKLSYYIGEEFDDTGLVVTACYNNGQKYAVEDYTISGFDSLTTGTKNISITFEGIEKTFSVVVIPRLSVQTGGSVIVTTAIGRLSENVTVPVKVTKNTGLSGFCHTITFDKEQLEFKGIKVAEAFKNGTVIVNDEKALNGEITVLWFNSVDVANSGMLYELEFTVREDATDGITEIKIDFDSNDHGNSLGEDVLFDAVNGNVDVRSYWLGDLNGDRKYAMVDLLQLAQYVSGKEMTLTDKQKLSADVNEDGQIDIHDVVMLNQWLLVAEM